MEIKKIVITGGPCAGKSTALERVKRAFSQRGYTVLILSETATQIITGGVTPWACRTHADFQKCLLRLQIAKEEAFAEAAATMDAEKILIVCDRGALDNKAYLDEADFQKMIAKLGLTEAELLSRYDAVFHLVTAAKGGKAFYTTANNAARTETPDEAAALDDRLIAAWSGHPRFRVIDPFADFETKIGCLIAAVASLLGEPDDRKEGEK